jgi:hypothetical protein
MCDAVVEGQTHDCIRLEDLTLQTPFASNYHPFTNKNSFEMAQH